MSIVSINAEALCYLVERKADVFNLVGAVGISMVPFQSCQFRKRSPAPC
jgi:hypothetical protein